MLSLSGSLNALLLPGLSGLPTLAESDPAAHVYNHVFIKNADGYWLWSGNQGNLVLSGLILIVVGWFVASKVQTGPESQGTDRYITRNKFAHMVEVICVYLREEVARPLLGDRTNKLMPFLWTLFFFILVNNLLGLVPILDLVHLVSPELKAEHATPIGGTATQNIWVTGTLAVISGLFFNIVAIRHLGIGGYFAHMTAGAPFPASVLIFFLELLSQIVIKPFALAMRLFANMTAGHILLATLFGFAATLVTEPLYIGGPVTLISVLGGIGIMLLELFVAFMQAFVFMFLTTVFIALMDHHDHEHEHEHGHDHGHAHAHGHEHA
ncbi:MAG TPA: F0F1 ATP synthase subunit A [Phycisphaerales bacterium]|nr:F0F1 ATP synthase subunit A [Phycisphaerales bacterium]